MRILRDAARPRLRDGYDLGGLLPAVFAAEPPCQRFERHRPPHPARERLGFDLPPRTAGARHPHGEQSETIVELFDVGEDAHGSTWCGGAGRDVHPVRATPTDCTGRVQPNTLAATAAIPPCVFQIASPARATGRQMSCAQRLKASPAAASSDWSRERRSLPNVSAVAAFPCTALRAIPRWPAAAQASPGRLRRVPSARG